MARSGARRGSESRFSVLILIALSLALLVTQKDRAAERRATPLLSDSVQAPVAGWLGAPIRALERTVTDAEDRRRAFEENKALREELKALRAETVRQDAMRLRLHRLEALMQVSVDADVPAERITARVVSDTTGPFVRAFLIGVGREDGVSEGNPVVSYLGLVGHIVRAGPSSARVLRLDDLSSRIAVMNERTRARAILTGNNSDQPGLSFIADPTGWEIGDRILTSGDDGGLPMGLPVGTVVAADAGLAAQLDYRAAPVDWVYILPFAPVTAPPETEDGEPESLEDGDAAQSTQAPTIETGEPG